jgi:hypothetical protein
LPDALEGLYVMSMELDEDTSLLGRDAFLLTENNTYIVFIAFV